MFKREDMVARLFLPDVPVLGRRAFFFLRLARFVPESQILPPSMHRVAADRYALLSCAAPPPRDTRRTKTILLCWLQLIFRGETACFQPSDQVLHVFTLHVMVTGDIDVIADWPAGIILLLLLGVDTISDAVLLLLLSSVSLRSEERRVGKECRL